MISVSNLLTGRSDLTVFRQHRFNEVKCCDLLDNYEVDTSVLAAPLQQKYHQLSDTARHAVGVLASMEPNTAAGMSSTARLLHDMNQPLEDVRLRGRRLELEPPPPPLAFQRTPLRGSTGALPAAPLGDESARTRHGSSPAARLASPGGGLRSGSLRPSPSGSSIASQDGTLPPAAGAASGALGLHHPLLLNGAGSIDFQVRASLADPGGGGGGSGTSSSMFWPLELEPPGFRTSLSISIGGGGGDPGLAGAAVRGSPIRAAVQWTRRREPSPPAARRRLYTADPERGSALVPCSRTLVRPNAAAPAAALLPASLETELRLSRLASAGALQPLSACLCQPHRPPQRRQMALLPHTGQLRLQHGVRLTRRCCRCCV